MTESSLNWKKKKQVARQDKLSYGNKKKLSIELSSTKIRLKGRAKRQKQNKNTEWPRKQYNIHKALKGWRAEEQAILLGLLHEKQFGASSKGAKGTKSVLRLQLGKSLLPMKSPRHVQYVFKRQGKREARAGAENSREAGGTGMELSNSNQKEEDIIPHKEQSSTWSKKIDSHCRHLKHIWEANTGDNFAGYDKAAKSSIMTEDMRTSRTTAGGRDKVLLILSCRTSETKIETTHKAIKTSSVTKRQQRAELEQPVQRDITGQ